MVVTAEEFADAIPAVVWYLDDPVADPALVPLYFVAREARKHVKVVLSGEGADELFGGYTIYREPISLAWAFDSCRGRLRRALGALSPPAARRACAARTCCAGRRSRSRSATTATPATSSGTTSWPSCCAAATPTCRTSTVTEELYRQTRAAGYDDVTAMQYVDLFTWLRGDILVKADKMTMANSLELRVPFLDPEVFALASTLPLDQRVPRGGRDEVRAAAGDGADRAARTILQPAQARLPGADPDFLAGPLHDWARQIIDREPDRRVAGPRRTCSAMLDAHRANQRSRLSGRLPRKVWEVLVFMVWHGIFVEERIKPEIPETGLPRPAVTGTTEARTRDDSGPQWFNARRASGQLSGTSRRRRRSRRRSGCRS